MAGVVASNGSGVPASLVPSNEAEPQCALESAATISHFFIATAAVSRRAPAM